jgi:hypothetical protein
VRYPCTAGDVSALSSPAPSLLNPYVFFFFFFITLELRVERYNNL